MTTLREQIGEESFSRLEEVANNHVGQAMQMELVDQYRNQKYYRIGPLLDPLIEDFNLFEEKGLKVTPVDIVRILFCTKLLYATQTSEEFEQRVGASLLEEIQFRFVWTEREMSIHEVEENHFHMLEQSVTERVIVTQIQDFNTFEGMGSPSEFFDNLFASMAMPFDAFFDEVSLIEKHKKYEPGLREYTLEKAKRYFVSPSISYTLTGSNSYCYYYGSAQLRSFLNMLRVAGFLYRGQIDFGMWDVQITAPSTPFFLEPGAMGGANSWEEDTKKPFERIPDGCLFLSFGYRGLAKIYFDNRSFAGIEKFYMDHAIVLNTLRNPWASICIEDIAPSLEILSSATQTTDLGAKILQIYCCLEHLFVPKNVRKDNVKYIVGAINALRPDLQTWFDKLYRLRCDYAHKGFVIKDDETLSLVFESVGNTFSLLTAKLKQNT